MKTIKVLPPVPKFTEISPDETFIVDRISESPTGRILIPTHIVTKYRKVFNRYSGTNGEIRSEIINKYQEYI
jgi:hypothetical protein